MQAALTSTASRSCPPRARVLTRRPTIAASVIGATAHYVTADLDEADHRKQDVTPRPSHADSTAVLGHVERRVLPAVRFRRSVASS